MWNWKINKKPKTKPHNISRSETTPSRTPTNNNCPRSFNSPTREDIEASKLMNLSTNGDDALITGVTINLLRILNFTDGTKNNNKENDGYTSCITKD